MVSDSRAFTRTELPRQCVVSALHFGPYAEVNDTWHKVLALAQRREITGQSTTAIGVCYDDPTSTPAEKIRYSACLSLPEDSFEQLRKEEAALGRFGMSFEIIEGGPTISVVHRGSYPRICDTYTSLLQQVAFRSSEFAKVGPPYYEIYRNNPQFTPPDELITEIHLPLQTERR